MGPTVQETYAITKNYEGFCRLCRIGNCGQCHYAFCQGVRIQSKMKASMATTTHHFTFFQTFRADSLIQTLDGADKVIAEAVGLMNEGLALIDSVIYSQDQLVIDTKDACNSINEMCPEVREPICTNITDVASCNFQGIIENTEGMEEFLSFIANARSLVMDQLNQTRNDILQAIDFANNISDIR